MKHLEIVPLVILLLFTRYIIGSAEGRELISTSNRVKYGERKLSENECGSRGWFPFISHRDSKTGVHFLLMY